jgi:hypothetical protein
MKTTANNRISTIAIALALVFSVESATAASATVLANWNDGERIAPRSVLPEGQRDDIAPNSQPGGVLASWNDGERIAPRSVLPEGQLDDIAPNSQAGVILASWNDGERIAPRSVLPEGQHRGLLV